MDESASPRSARGCRAHGQVSRAAASDERRVVRSAAVQIARLAVYLQEGINMFGTLLWRFAACCAALGAVAATPAFAQNWPVKPVRFVVPFPPAGSVDPLARLLSVRLSESLGQQFIVENKTGASGSIGTAFVAKSPPDGYTFVVVFDTHAVNPSLIPNMPFDTVKDLAPVMLVGTAPMAIVTSPAKPYKT